jgi:hypothetical protein
MEIEPTPFDLELMGGYNTGNIPKPRPITGKIYKWALAFDDHAECKP